MRFSVSFEISLPLHNVRIITEAINGALPSARCTGVRLYNQIRLGSLEIIQFHAGYI